jgi:hypothetical protein
MSDPESAEQGGHHGDFWSQVPVVLFTMAAVAALFWVNNRTQAAPQEAAPAPTAPANEVRLAPIDCKDCGEVIAIRPASDDAAESPVKAVLVDVRMTDGSVRTIKQLSNGFDVGDRVHVNGNALVAGG